MGSFGSSFGILYIYIPNRFVQHKYGPHLRCHPWSTVVCSIAVIAQLFRLSTHPETAELRVAPFAPLDRHLRRLARASGGWRWARWSWLHHHHLSDLLPAGVQEGGEGGMVAGLPGFCLRRSGGGGVESPFL